MRLEQNVVDHTDGVESLTTERSFVQRAKDQHLGGVPCQVHAIIEKGKTSQMFQVGSTPLSMDVISAKRNQIDCARALLLGRVRVVG
jgi:hypothetical protein